MFLAQLNKGSKLLICSYLEKRPQVAEHELLKMAF